MQLFNDNRTIQGLKKEETEIESTLYLYDAIGEWYGVSAKDFVKELSAVKAETIRLRINSPGGDVFDARAIATALKQCGKKTVACIDGVCASAATYVALSCNEVEIADGAFFMIHKAWTLAMGNADDFLATAELLEKIDGSIADDYARKANITRDEALALMAAETWYTSSEALERGFVDRIAEGAVVENKFNLDAYENTPKALAESAKKWYDREKFEKRLQLIEATA
jgi:ATP-dependent Clp protease, protease subunit